MVFFPGTIKGRIAPRAANAQLKKRCTLLARPIRVVQIHTLDGATSHRRNIAPESDLHSVVIDEPAE